MQLFEKLKSLREERGKTQNEVANYLGISRVTYTNYELNKRKPDFETVLKLSKYYNVTTDYLLGNDDLLFENNTSNMKLGDFAARLKILRQKNKITQKELALDLGISPERYNQYETGKRAPDLQMLATIADYYRVTTDYLLGKSNTPSPAQEPDIKKDKVAISVMGYGAKQEVKYIDRDKYDKIKATLDILFSEE